MTVATVEMGFPTQPLADGVIVYVAVPPEDESVVRGCAIVLPDPAWAPLTLLCETVQLYVVAVTPLGLVMVMEVDWPEQSSCPSAAAFGTGLTVATAEIGFPTQPLADGMIVYVAVPPEDELVVRGCVIVAPDPPCAPLTLLWETVQLYVVPEIPLGLDSVIKVDWPEQSSWLDAAAIGTGFTVTVR